jgi:RNA polymerase sigma-70 factor (ECF subfamily)
MAKLNWVTTTQILDELISSGDAPAWEVFFEHFRPVIVNFGRKIGLSVADAEDAAQESLMTFLQSFRAGKYERDKGKLSSWLFGISKRVILKSRSRIPLEKLIVDKDTGTSFWDLIQDDWNLNQIWESQWQQVVLKRCLDQVRREFDSKTLKAFELYALTQHDIKEVTKQLGMSRNSVYISKSRVLSRLRDLRCKYEELV